MDDTKNILSQSFTAQLEGIDGPMVQHLIPVPDEIAAKFKQAKGAPRILCSIQNGDEFPCALNPRHGRHVILASLQLIRKHKLDSGQTFQVNIRIDPHNGLKLPEELAEVLIQDDHGSQVYERLKDGHKRGLIHYVSSAKSIDTRIKRALEIVEKIKVRFP